MNFYPKTNLNFPVLLRVVGWLLMIESLFMSIPLATALVYHDDSIKAFSFTFILTISFGLAMTFGIRPTRRDMGKRDAILLTALVWVIFSIFGMMPFMIAPPYLSISDAFFEAVSGFTTTGSSVIRDIENAPQGIQIWRSVMQWIGGMGIILFTLAVLPMLNHQGGIQMFNAEVTGITHDKIRPRISQTAKSLWFVYIGMTVIGFFMLWICGMPAFDSLCHIMATVSTGGASTANDSLMAYDSRIIHSVVLLFMFLGGTNFVLIFRAIQGNFKLIWKNDTFKWYISLILVFSCVLSSVLLIKGFYPTWGDSLFNSLFEVVSIMTTTGFTIANYENWGDFAILIFFLIMFFGGCAGSTTGGAKIDRLILIMKNTSNEFYRILHPNSIVSVRVNNRAMPFDVVSKVIAFLGIYAMLIAISGLLLTLCGVDIYNALAASLSAMSNVGIGIGITGFEGSWGDIPDSGLWVLSFTMLTGRLELFTFLVIFTKYFWTK